MANHGNYPRDFRLLPGDWEKWFKIWSLPDYAGELTAALCIQSNPIFLDTCLIKTPNYYRQFALSLGKDSP